MNPINPICTQPFTHQPTNDEKILIDLPENLNPVARSTAYLLPREGVIPKGAKIVINYYGSKQTPGVLSSILAPSPSTRAPLRAIRSNRANHQPSSGICDPQNEAQGWHLFEQLKQRMATANELLSEIDELIPSE